MQNYCHALQVGSAYLASMIDDKWFKQQQRKAGVTADDIARAAGRSRSAVSHIYMGRQRMNLDWAKAFAEVLKVPLDEVLRRAGITDEPTAQLLSPGFSDSDAAPFVPASGEAHRAQSVAQAFGARPGVDVWMVRTSAMALQGILPGDMMLVDTHRADSTRPGDVVVAQVYDHNRGKASTVLRRLEPPVLVAASVDPEDRRALVVDGVNVVVRGKVTACWRVFG